MIKGADEVDMGENTMIEVTAKPQRFDDFPIEGITDFYHHIIRQRPVKNYYLDYIHIIRTYRGKPRRRFIEEEIVGTSYNSLVPYQTIKTKVLWTGAGACGYSCIVEKVYFRLSYRNINYKKRMTREGLYLRGLVNNTNRTGGMNIRWRLPK